MAALMMLYQAVQWAFKTAKVPTFHIKQTILQYVILELNSYSTVKMNGIIHSVLICFAQTVAKFLKSLDPRWTTVWWLCTMAALMMIYQAVPTLRFTATSGRFLFVSQKVA